MLYLERSLFQERSDGDSLSGLCQGLPFSWLFELVQLPAGESKKCRRDPLR
jgi:hypothetical protein